MFFISGIKKATVLLYTIAFKKYKINEFTTYSKEFYRYTFFGM